MYLNSSLDSRAFLPSLVVGLVLVLSSSLPGQVIWLGETDNFWHTPGNWDSEMVPTAADMARIDDDPGTDSLVILDNNGTFEVEVGELRVDVGDEIRLNGQDLILGTVFNDGLIAVDGANAMLTSDAMDLAIEGSGTVFLDNNSSTITANGTLTIGTGQTVSGPVGSIRCFSGIFTNNGTIEAKESGNFGNRVLVGFSSSPMVVNNGVIRAMDQGNIAFNTPIVDGGVLEARNGSQIVLSNALRVRNATLITDSGTGSVFGQFVEVNLENINLQGLVQPVIINYTGDLVNTGYLDILNAFNPNLVLDSDMTVTGDGTIAFPNGGNNISGDFDFVNNGNVLRGLGTFMPSSVVCNNSFVTLRNGNDPLSSGVMEFRCPTSFGNVELEIQLQGNRQNNQAPNVSIANTYQDINEFLMVLNVVEYDQLNVFDALTLTDQLTLIVSLTNDFVPGASDVFDVLTADSLIGMDQLSFNFPDVDGIIFDPQVLNLPDPTTGTDRDVVRIDIKLLGDVNQDDSVDLIDVAPFVALISAGTFQIEADINRDGVVNLLDVAGFVALLSG